MKFDKRNISVDSDYEWPIDIYASGYEIVRKGAGINADRIIKPKNLDNKEPKNIKIESIYKKISKFLFKEDYRSMPVIYDNRPVLKEHFNANEDFISADEKGFLQIINEFGLLCETQEESTEIWLSILKYIAHRGSYAILDDTRIPSYDTKSGYEVQLFESEVNQFIKINEQIKTIIKKDGFHLHASSLGSALILFALKYNFPQVKKCQNIKGNCKEFFIDYTKAQKGLFCKSSCTREQNRDDVASDRITAEREFIEEDLIPKIEKSGWSKSDINLDYIISKRLRTRADIVLTYEDKPLVMIEVKLLHSKKTLNDEVSDSIGDIEMRMQIIRHAREIKAPYAMVCSNKKNYLIDIEKTKTWQEGTLFLSTYDGISEVDSIITPDQARGLEDA